MRKLTKVATLIALGTVTLTGCSKGNEIHIQELNPGDSYVLVSDTVSKQPEAEYKRNLKGELVLKTKGDRVIYLNVENTGISSNEFPNLTIAIKGTDKYMDCMEPFASALTEGTAITQGRLLEAHTSCGGLGQRMRIQPIEFNF